MNHPEIPVMQSIAQGLQEASRIERPAYSGMYISLPGTLTLAARALREMATPPDTSDETVLEQHENRLHDSQPNMRAQGLEDLANHLGMLKKAIESGDHAKVRQFFEVYRFD